MTALPLSQSPGFAAALSLLGRPHRWVVYEGHAEGRALIVKLPALGWMMSRGPIWRSSPTQADRDALNRMLRRAGLRLSNPLAQETDALPRHGFAQILTPATIATLPLRPDWRARSHGKWRNRLTRAQAACAEARITPHVARFDPVRHGWLLQACAAQARARRYRDWPERFTLAFAQANPDACYIAWAADTAPLAGMLFLRHGTGATYHSGWTSPKGRALDLHRVLLDHALPRLTALGCTALDLGVIDTQTQPGLARFKLGSGAQPQMLGGTWLRLPGRAGLARLRSALAPGERRC